LTAAAGRPTIGPAPAKSGAGLGRPTLQALKAPLPSRRFFYACSQQAALHALRRAAWGHRKVCRFLEPVGQPRAVRHLSLGRVTGGLHPIQESHHA